MGPLSPALKRFAAAVAFFALALSTVPAIASGTAPKLPNPGFRSIGVWDEADGVRFDVAVWYPTQRAMRDVQVEGWFFQAGKDGFPLPGLYPVILISHGAASSRLGSHDLAAHLARNGFVVIAPTHPGDSAYNTGSFFRAANFADRPGHLVRALDKAYSIPALANVMDRSRIGVLGIGTGAATALQLAGAFPDLSLLSSYCPQETSFEPLCSQWGKTFHPAMEKEFAALVAKTPVIFTPFIRKVRPPARGDTVKAALPARQSAETESAKPDGRQPSQETAVPDVVDPEKPETAAAFNEGVAERQPVFAVGLLAPGEINLFTDASIRAVTAPVGVFSPARDEVYASEAAVVRLKKLLPQSVTSRVLPKGNVFDVQAPCPPAYLDSFAALCGRETSFAQEARRTRNIFFTRFFQKSLGLPLPPPEAAVQPPR